MPFIVPTGVVNGINKTFTVPTTIVSIDEIVVDGAIYLGGIAINVNQFTLDDAPTVSIFIDYADAPLPPPPPPISGVYFSSDIDLDEMANMVLRELREPEVIGSEAVSVALVWDTLNMVYSEAYNDQRMKQSAREANVSFQLANDTTLISDTPAGSNTLVLTDSSSFRPTGKVLMLSEIVDYSGNDLIQTLTGVTNMMIPQLAGAIVRQLYRLTDLAPTIQDENIQYLDVNGIPQTFMEYPMNIAVINFYPNSYSIYKKHLIVSRQSTVGGNSQRQNALLMYTQKVVPMTQGTDLPDLIPNSWRVPILVYGACMKIAASDAFRTSWDWWKAEYDKALSQYIAFKNTRVKDINNRRRPTLYNNYSNFF